MNNDQEIIQTTTTSVAELLERVLDKGIVIAGDIRIDLVDIELLTIRIRLLIASVDKAKEMGINWWEGDPFLNTTAVNQIRHENRQLKEKILALEKEIKKQKGGEQNERSAGKPESESKASVNSGRG